MLPRPTAAPTALRENARPDDQRWPLTSTSQPQQRRSRSDCDYACRESGTALLLGPHDDDDRSGFRHLVQVREHFNLVVIEPENVALEGVIVLGGGEAGIRIRGLVPRGCDAAVLVQELEHRLAPS